MSMIESLSYSLAGMVAEAFSGLASVGNCELMNRQRVLIHKRLGDEVVSLLPNEKVAKALQQFKASGVISGSKHVYLLCWGLVSSVNGSPPFIEQENFTKFLDELGRCFYENQLSGLAWRGLLHAYFNYAGMSAESQLGKANWQVLRSFLRRSLEPLYQLLDSTPAWLSVLRENQNLLGENPYAAYVDAVLAGDHQSISNIIHTLVIPETSWFVEKAILSPVDRICGWDDGSFKGHLPEMLQRIGEHPLYLDKGLTLLLDRYQRCVDSVEHELLGTFSMEHWGNLKLAQNAKWNLVQGQTKAMVLAWLIASDISDFFSLFQQHGQVDYRRMDFWLRYVDNIQDAYFVLGASALSSRNADYVDVMRRNNGRVSQLLLGGSSKNNAFVMMVGEYALVEFGSEDDACYCFNRSKLPYQLDKLSLKGNSEELKNEMVVVVPFPMMHIDTNRWGAWENGFAFELKRLGIIPSR